MKAMAFDQFGGPEVLRVVDVPAPKPGPGQVRVKVKAVGVNPLDWKIRNGWAPFPVELPYIGGLEVSGVVDEVGPGVDEVRVGDDVFGRTSQGLAEYAILTTFAAKPAHLSWAQAAALPVAVETVHRTLSQLDIQDGQTLVVYGAGGVVGRAAVQIAVSTGVRVIGAVRRESQLRLVEEMGGAPVLSGIGMVERIRAITPDGVDAALDCVGHGGLEPLVTVVSDPSHVITIADPTAPTYGVRFSAGGTPPRAQDLAHAAEMVVSERLAIPVAQTFPLERVGEAQSLSESGRVGGKIVIVLDDEKSVAL